MGDFESVTSYAESMIVPEKITVDTGNGGGWDISLNPPSTRRSNSRQHSMSSSATNSAYTPQPIYNSMTLGRGLYRHPELQSDNGCSFEFSALSNEILALKEELIELKRHECRQSWTQFFINSAVITYACYILWKHGFPDPRL